MSQLTKVVSVLIANWRTPQAISTHEEKRMLKTILRKLPNRWLATLKIELRNYDISRKVWDQPRTRTRPDAPGDRGLEEAQGGDPVEPEQSMDPSDHRFG